MARELLVPNPENASIHDLKETGRVGSNDVSLRCTSIQMLTVGISREQVCAALLVDDRSLQRWIGAFNQQGVDGLLTDHRSGRPRKIQEGQVNEFVELIEQPEQADRDFWTARAFHGYICEHYQVDCSYETIVRFFHEQNFALKVPQPWPDRQDEEQRQSFRKELKALCQQPDVDIWYSDESGFEGDPRPRRRWDKKGAKTRSTKNGDHIRMNVIGLVSPRTGEFFAIEASHVDTEMFQAFLDEANRQIKPERKRNILILDNASWHRRASINWGSFEPFFLPPYSPDLNPIERIWLTLKDRWFNNHISKNRDALIKRLDKAILDVIDNPDRTKKTAAIGQHF